MDWCRRPPDADVYHLTAEDCLQKRKEFSTRRLPLGMNRFEKRRAEMQPKWAVILTNVNDKFRSKLAEILAADPPAPDKKFCDPLEFRIAVLLRRSRQLHYGRLPAHSKGAAKEIAVLRALCSRFRAICV
jgi:hypothetical protein